MQQRTTGRSGIRVAVIRTEPKWYSLYPVINQGAPDLDILRNKMLCNKKLK